ncbi:hypothetical protein [Hyphobacterium sp.]|uniref:hypothetical protein n=1 Tax=Hyphobacterium sp. TaxID=2004662 RepID=UPI003BAA36BD
MRYLIALILMFAGMFALADAQQRAMRGAQSERPGPGSTQCLIRETVFTRGGAGFVCDQGSDGRVLMATDGGTRPGGVSAFVTWLIEADNNQVTTVDFITVNYEAADAATQAICDASGLRGASNRSPIPCYKILAVID